MGGVRGRKGAYGESIFQEYSQEWYVHAVLHITYVKTILWILQREV